MLNNIRNFVEILSLLSAYPKTENAIELLNYYATCALRNIFIAYRTKTDSQ